MMPNDTLRVDVLCHQVVFYSKGKATIIDLT